MVELTWDGKYDVNGRKVAPLRLKLPFQTVETVNESAQERQMRLDMFTTGRPAEWRNRLIWGDKKYVLPALLDEFAGEVNLIYIDPPFNVGADFSFTTTIPESPDDEDAPTPSFVKEPSILEQKAYRDTWGRGLDSYLQWFYETAILLRELLHESGSLYVHLDWHVGHYAKVVLDEVFGSNGFRNEVVWKRSAIATNVNTQWRNSHDVLLFYSKGEKPTFYVQYGEYSESSKKHFSYSDKRGVYSLVPLLGSGRTTKGETGEIWRDIDPGTIGKDGMHWLKKPSVLDQLDEEGRIYWPEKGGLPRLKYYLDESKGRYVSDLWDDISIINSMAAESVGYATQKPEALLERILNASSNPGDLVLDCFCGSGTTPAVAEKLGRRWIACDLGRFAIHTTRKRLLGIPDVKPFVVQNLGKYERQAWQRAEFASQQMGESAEEQAQTQKSQIQNLHQAYINFILQLYHARPITGYVWLHGVKGGRMVHVGAVDAPISPGDVTQIALEFHKAVGSGADAPTVNGVDILGWDFAFELNEVAKQQATLAKLNVRFVRIPREVLEKKAVEQGDIKFFELAALAVDVAQKKRGVTLRLTDFVIPPDDVPADVQAAISHWSQWIDYWAVDWDNHDDTFHNMWQTYRTRKDKSLALEAAHTYEAPGEYRIMVKVIDILGNDTTKTLMVRIG